LIMSKMKFGPTGIGGVKEAVSNLERFKEMGFEAAEVLFTYGVYIKNKEDALEIGRVAKRFGIFLSIHAPYYVNLNSKEKEKIEASKKRILNCCEVASWLGARRVVFHPGFYSGMSSEDAGVKIIEGIEEMQSVIKDKGWDVELCPEVMGKKNVFGSIEEIGRLIKETGCGACIDIAHILARYGRYEFEEIRRTFDMKKWHVHFSGIEYGDKGEKKHKLTPDEDWKKVLGFLKELDKDVVLICESPDAVKDSLNGLDIWKGLK
jgi:deoxyribonuclease-4